MDIEITEEALGNDPKARSALFDEPDENELDEITQIRKDLTNALIRDENGKLVIPDKTSDKVLLAQLLDGRERQVMTKARLKISSNTNDELGSLADIVAQSLRKFRPAKERASADDRVIPDEMLNITLVPGETDIGNIGLTKEELIAAAKTP